MCSKQHQFKSGATLSMSNAFFTLPVASFAGSPEGLVGVCSRERFMVEKERWRCGVNWEDRGEEREETILSFWHFMINCLTERCSRDAGKVSQCDGRGVLWTWFHYAAC